ncbi:Hypothetical Protein FCC1311_011132 [Hondaea fermentalgiana]|uniref:Uncharacterized protein n=1 Tax=Hondaea fermentalgiana TaxID=2315210 RepID=A0A2R5G2Y8_9STRA|nr:Hypothetical Protein FCC1311_011132 [Hondaea fermentalgiana]|eukprot:GBG24895.1 Hypothetical Protein FCC1311_011132 [Hondaea fermentalgiana]
MLPPSFIILVGRAGPRRGRSLAVATGEGAEQERGEHEDQDRDQDPSSLRAGEHGAGVRRVSARNSAHREGAALGAPMPGDESGSAAGLAAVSASQLQEQREQQPATAAENKAGEQEGRGDVAQKAASPIGPATRDERGSAIATLPRLPLSTGRETNKRRRPDSIYRNVDSALTGEDEHDDNITAEREAQTTADTSAATLEYVEPESPVQRIPSKYAAHIPTSASQPLGDLVQRRKPLSPIPVPSPLRSLKRARSITRTDYGQQSENNNFADLVETDILETCALRTPGKPMALDQTTRASHVPSTSRKIVSAKDRRQSQACPAYEEEKDLARFGGASEASRGLSEVAAAAPPQDASATPRTAQGQRGSNTENSSPPGPKQIGNLEDAIRYSREVAARPPKPRSATRHQP